MQAVRDISSLVTLIKGRTDKRFVVGIDGMDGIGKTPLAKEIAAATGAQVLSLDDFLNRRQGTYVNHLRVKDIQTALSGGNQRTIMEGVCLLAAAERCGVPINVHVYVKRIATNGLWHDEQICLTQGSVEKLKQRDRELRSWANELSGGMPDDKVDEPGLREELIDYHAQYLPVQRADLIFELMEEWS